MAMTLAKVMVEEEAADTFPLEEAPTNHDVNQDNPNTATTEANIREQHVHLFQKLREAHGSEALRYVRKLHKISDILARRFSTTR